MKASLFGWESPRPAAIIRIGLGLVLLWDALPRWPDIVELYSTAGMTLPLFPGTLFEPTALSARPRPWGMAGATSLPGTDEPGRWTMKTAGSCGNFVAASSPIPHRR